MQIDVAIPTKNSGPHISQALEHISAAVQATYCSVNKLIIVDDESHDDTVANAEDFASAEGWHFEDIVAPTSLPKARERAISTVDSEWFLFLDDDVRVHESYLQHQLAWTCCEKVGAIQGRKASRDEHPTEWHRRRARRGGTHATLIRTNAVQGVSIPSDVTVLEDEYLRRWVEAQGYTWVQDATAIFDHESQDRHPIGWTEGRVAGQYDLKPFHEVALNVLFAMATGRNPIPHAKRTVGWLAGQLRSGETPTPESVSDQGVAHGK